MHDWKQKKISFRYFPPKSAELALESALYIFRGSTSFRTNEKATFFGMIGIVSGERINIRPEERAILILLFVTLCFATHIYGD